MKVLETRRTPEGFKRRRYESDHGVRFTTIEVPVTVWNGAVRHDAAARRAEQWRRAMRMRSAKARGETLLRAGWKPVAVAELLGVEPRTAQKWRRGLK